MNDYTDLLLAMGAMVIYSILLMNTNNSLLISENKKVETEIEHTAISLGRSIIDEVRIQPFQDIDNELSNYGQSVAGSKVPPAANFSFQDRVTISWADTVGYGIYDARMDIYYVNRDLPDVLVFPGPTNYQRIDVTVSSKFLSNEVSLSYIRSRY